MSDPALIAVVWLVAFIGSASCILSAWMLFRIFKDH